ncbi:hypothetical protein AB0K71_18360 [Streptomyces syringium]|uniref:hypothetical protein n=1 Tax=Streptomyces syringium TaxID=76729 RepID=UPI00343E4795
MLSYILVYALAWVAIGLVAPRGATAGPDGNFEDRPLWESFQSYMETGLIFFLFVGIPSIFIIVLTGLSRQAMEPPMFRAMVTGLILLPTVFLLFGDVVEELLIQVAAQVVFATLVMPVPLIPQSGALHQDQKGEQSV